MTTDTKSVGQILEQWVSGQTPNPLESQQLLAEELADHLKAKAFGITEDNGEQVIQARSHLFEIVYPDILRLPYFETTPEKQQKTLLCLWNLWLPLAMELVSCRKQLGRPLIQGILGGQGTGKTTLAAVLSVILHKIGDGRSRSVGSADSPAFSERTLSLSIDDLYKTYKERQQLQEQDRRLIWRGPPGTHDVELGLQLLDQLRSPSPTAEILVPRFDKSAFGGAGDRITPEVVESIDIVLFEGWFVGVRPIEPEVFDGSLPEPIQTLEDREFARDMNQQLKLYVPLWERLDRLMVLYPTDYRLSQQWRLQAEKQMIAQGKSGMGDTQIRDFVNYFWKALHPELFITPLTRNPNLVDLVLEINPDHTPGVIYSPRDAD
ncbi:MAG: glycerate kinase [Moorea sp. SIO3G5]|nr:glycerate kinase [Moorena sp. SIO3G5]